MKRTGNLPEFYTGSPVDTTDLRFRDTFISELWGTLSTSHALLTAPRRTGKTSVMDYMRENPGSNFQVVSINVRELLQHIERDGAES